MMSSWHWVWDQIDPTAKSPDKNQKKTVIAMMETGFFCPVSLEGKGRKEESKEDAPEYLTCLHLHTMMQKAGVLKEQSQWAL